MGLNLQRERFLDWLGEYRLLGRGDFLARLEQHVGQPIDPESWQVEDDAYPKVGSYTAYGVFYDCLRFVTEGDYGAELGEDEDIEREAIAEFRKVLRPRSLSIPYASHFLDTGISDTIFIPILFDSPLEYEEHYVASLPGGVRALEAFAEALAFDLKGGPEPEIEDGQWLPVATARNIARILYGFFTEKSGACVVSA
jgi:hypothetical protein